MRRKRLRHAPNQLCQMFRGWQLRADKPTLAELGSGLLEIDVLTRACRFDRRPIPSLHVVAALADWLREELARMDVPETAVVSATLHARLDFSAVSWAERSTRERWFRHGEPVEGEPLARCRISCRGTVATDERVYRGSLEDVEEWPLRWPAD